MTVLRRLSVLVMVWVLSQVSGSVYAQTATPGYQLRVPSLLTYASELDPLFGQFASEIPAHYGKVPRTPFLWAYWYSLRYTYADDDLVTLPASAFDGVFNIFTVDDIGLRSASGPLAVSQISWRDLMVTHMLNQVPYEDGPLRVAERYGGDELYSFDIDGNGDAEYWIQFSGFNTHGLMVFDEGADGIYRVVPLDLPMISQSYMPPIIGYSDGYNVLALQDTNWDRYPEWVINERSRGYFYCTDFYVLQWNNGAIQQIADTSSIDRCNGEIAFTALPSTAVAMQFRQNNIDNWQCGMQRDVLLGWQNGQLVPTANSGRRIYDNTLNCELRRAEQLMWRDSYRKAVPIYERALTLPQLPNEHEQDHLRYTQMRLVVAYALTGRLTEADQLLARLYESPTYTPQFRAAIVAMREAPLTDIGICTAIHDVFATASATIFNYNLPIIVGRNGGIISMLDDYPPDPSLAACDLPGLLDRRLRSARFFVGRTRVLDVEALGIEVNQTIQGDFNGDGIEDWIFVPAALVDAVVLISESTAEYYRVQRIQLVPHLQRWHTVTQQTPSGSTVVATWTTETTTIGGTGPSPCVTGGSAQDTAAFNNFQLWAWLDGQLQAMIDVPVCDTIVPAMLFSDDGSTLYATASASPEGTHWSGRQYTQGVYRWDAATERYVLTELPNIPGGLAVLNTPTPTPVPEPLTTNADLYMFMAGLFNRYEAGDYQTALDEIDGALANATVATDPIVTHGLRYWRGLTLLYLGRDAEALAAWVQLAQNAPGSSWGQLAALHLEPQP